MIEPTPKSRRSFKLEYKIALTYLVIGFLWILFSDKVLDMMEPDDTLLTKFQTYKGSFFILVTTIMLYLLVQRHMKRLGVEEAKRMESERHYRALFNDNLAVILLMDPISGKIEDANQAACNYYGWDYPEMCEKTIFEINTSNKERIRSNLAAIVSGKINHFEFKHRLANGEIRDVEVFTGPIQLGDRTLVYSHINDITEQKIAREIIRKNDERYRNTLDQMIEGCQIIGFDWNYLYLNRAAEIHNKRPNDELMGRKYMDMWPGIESTRVFQLIKQSLEERTSSHFENEFVFPDGSIDWFDLSIQPVPEGVFILSINITERKLQEKQLYESEFRFNNLYESGPFGMVMADADFRFKKVNDAFCNILGYSEEELQQLRFTDVTHPDEIGKDLPNVRRLINREITVYKTEKRYIRKDGQIIWGSLTLTSTYDNEGHFLYNLGIVEDITPRKQAEELLKNSKKLLAETELIGKVGGWEFNIDTFQQTWTDEVYRIHEVDLDFKQDINAGINFYAPTSRPIIEDAVQRVIGLGEPFDLELEIITAKGNLRKVHTIGKPDLENRRVYGFFQDITERKKAEEEIKKLNETLEQRVEDRTLQLRQSNQELEAFSYSVSHDLRAPLRHVIGFSEKLESRLKTMEDPEVNRLTGKIKASAAKMSLLIDELLSYSRYGSTDLTLIPLSLDSMIDEIIREANDLIKGRNIEWNIQPLPSVTADPTLIRLVWQNLILNAIKFTSKKEHATIEIGCQQTSQKEIVFFVKDNGAGFRMSYADKLFGVFQRLHSTEEFEGTGIGLATVRRIINRHNGSVWAEGVENEGATLYFTLPR
ncbi:MAG: PAS domain S-box protein [Marinilabiliales bacterium]|nr:PAS domain S-box protein [Marinilabiliales bacterium]